jgi:hypothetical protein
MDCFIIRVYRHITQGNGRPDEIAGLVERVGRQDSGKPFSGYESLVDILRDEYTPVSDTLPDYTDLSVGGIRSARVGKSR